MRVHAFELRELLGEMLGRGLGPILRFGLEPALGIFLSGRVVAQFFLDLLELLVEEKLPLLLVEFSFDLALDVALEAQHGFLLVQQLQDAVCPGPDAFHFKQALLLGDFGVHVRSDEVHQEAQAVDAADGHARFRRDVRAELDRLMALCQSGRVFVLQESGRAYSVSAKDFLWQPEKLSANGQGWQGTFTIVVEEIA